MTSPRASGPSLITGSPLRAVTPIASRPTSRPTRNLSPTVPLAPCFFHDYSGLPPGERAWLQRMNPSSRCTNSGDNPAIRKRTRRGRSVLSVMGGGGSATYSLIASRIMAARGRCTRCLATLRHRVRSAVGTRNDSLRSFGAPVTLQQVPSPGSQGPPSADRPRSTALTRERRSTDATNHPKALTHSPKQIGPEVTPLRRRFSPP